MTTVKKIAALGLAVLMTASLAACSMGGDTKWAAKAGDPTVPAGVYINELITAYSDATVDLPSDVKDPLKEQVDGVTVSQKVTEEAKKGLDEYIAIEQKFSEMGLTMSELDKASVEQTAEQYWTGFRLEETYTANGVSRESFILAQENMVKKSMIFNAIYGEGGTDPVPEEELKTKFSTDYAKILLIPVSINPAEDTDEAKAKAKEQASELINKYLERAKAGEDMETLVYEARKELSGNQDLEKPEAGTSFTFVNRENSSYSQEVVDTIFAAPIGEPTVAESEDGMYLFVRYDVMENESDFAQRRAALVSALRGDAFDEQVSQWADSLTGVTYNDAALKRYTPEKLKVG